MKISKDIQRLARRLFLLCFTGSTLDEDRFRTLIARLGEKKPRHYLSVLQALHNLLLIEQSRYRVQVTSAAPLPEAETARIRTKIASTHGDNLHFEWTTDPAVIAGLRIQIADKVYDGTIRNRLERLQALSPQ